MDDPWGSPWATSDNNSTQELVLPPSPPKSLLSPPPRAFFSSSSNLPNHSPWADDDALTNWKGEDRSENGTQANEWGAWTDSETKGPQLSPQLDSSGRASPLAWPHSAATSPGLRPLPRSRASSVYRHHSPDPWASELPPGDRPGSLPPPSPNPNSHTPATPLPDTANDPPLIIRETPDTKIALSIENDGSRDNDEQLQAAQEKDDQKTSPIHLTTQANHATDADLKPEIDAPDSHSRPSSAFSVDSQNLPDRSDSPITSVDEDSKSRARITRKASGKVHELVGKFDGLARAASEEPTPPERHDSLRIWTRDRPPRQDEVDEDDQIDFGDFEDAEPDNGDATVESSATTTSASSHSSSTPKARFKDSFSLRQRSGSEAQSPPRPRSTALRVQQLAEKFGPARFEIDREATEGLFPDLDKVLANYSAEDDDVPDQLVTDSFISTSERKTWYRISRYGTMRKHDLGDDDNYHRVAWPTCQLHTETIKIVRRWMEEDSFSGRPTLGGSRRDSVFNWNSSATPVDLNKVFARKKSISHTRTTSIPAPQQKSVQSVAALENRPFRNSTGDLGAMTGIAPPPVANFGWNATTAGTPAAANSIIPPGERPRTDHTSQPTDITRPELELEDDEDDWGEMMSSPKVAAFPTATTSDIATPVSVLAAKTAGSAPKLSLAIPETSQPPKQTPGQPTPSEAKSAKAEPWPLADFSFFDKSARTPKAAAKQEPWPLADFSLFESPTSKPKTNTKWMNTLFGAKPRVDGEQPNDQKAQVSNAAPVAPAPVKPIKAVLGPVEKSNEMKDNETVARTIIRNLPDLSYMLR
ncbi:hypothetical protein F5Y15DRAFT_313106 [Xylariaceae sp. FL0016]|nr:hypothetical protein F5Y15DRAFT_313106 [Xylariaceae sp. FL0016]